MNAVVTTPFAAAKLEAIADRFELWQCTDAAGYHAGEPIFTEAFASLAEAVESGAGRFTHKSTFFVRQIEGLSGQIVLRFYRVRQESRPQYRRDPRTGQPVSYRKQYAEHSHDMAMTRDICSTAPADPRGPRALVEARS